MRRVPLACLLAALCLLGAPPAQARIPSEDLWATVNLCDTPEKPGAIGVRASMPPARKRLAQWMRIRIEYYSSADQVWHLVRSGGDSGWDRVGLGRKTIETGYTFSFAPPAAGSKLVMRGLVNYEWRRGTRVVAKARRRTEAGHESSTDPALAVSRATCEVVR